MVLVGDLNSEPDDITGALRDLRGRGYVNARAAVHEPGGGLTAGQTELLDNVLSELEHRIDYVLYQLPEVEAVAAEVLGEELEDAPPSGSGRPTTLAWSPRCTWHAHSRRGVEALRRCGGGNDHTAQHPRTTTVTGDLGEVPTLCVGRSGLQAPELVRDEPFGKDLHDPDNHSPTEVRPPS